jgi:GNAT superfamily N-acetyltransferase
MKLVLREALKSDASAVAEVLIASRHAFIPYAPMAHSASEVRTWVESSLIPSGSVTVACTSEAVVGVLATSQANGIAWIDQLYLLPGFVGKGLGALLLEHGLKSLARPVRLYTFKANAGARRFYEKHGFRAIAFSDGSTNEEKCPDVLFELTAGGENAA